MSKYSHKFMLKSFIFVFVIWLEIIYLLNYFSHQQTNNTVKRSDFNESYILYNDVADQIIRQLEVQHVRGSAVPREHRVHNPKPTGSSQLGMKSLLANLQEEGPGEMGKPVYVIMEELPTEEQTKYKDDSRIHGFSNYVSDLISLHRSLPDLRDQKCKEPGRYLDALLPSSVIVCFHDESWSALLRSVHSILDRTPDQLLKEIILVDDFSQFEHLKAPLEKYLALYSKVKLIRTTQREGLVRSRIIGAKVASGPVLTFLDSHIECSKGWLEPLLDVVSRYPKASAIPVIDAINNATFEIKSWSCNEYPIGGFDWTLTFRWHPVPKRVQKIRSNPCDLTPSPTMAGGLFSIRKEFFEQLGYYDRFLDVWGGENLELSFKISMCGGKIFQVPCSHVAHIFRKNIPYQERSSSQFGDFIRRNTMRVAEVWLDEYKEIYYRRMGGRNTSDNIGDLSEAISKRNELKCYGFDWFVKNVYPEVYIPEQGPANGEVRNLGDLSSPYCLDALENYIKRPVGILACHNMGGHQSWDFSSDGKIRNDIACIDFSGKGDIILYSCFRKGGNQLWIYTLETQQIFHKATKRCLAIDHSRRDNPKLTVSACVPLNGYNQWSISSTDKIMLSRVQRKFL